MKIPQITLLALILAVLGHAQQWKPPTPHNFQIETEDAVITVAEEVRDGAGDVKGKAFIRKLTVQYRVATSHRRQDQMTALFLGAPNEDAGLIDAVQYEGAAIAESRELHYVTVKFYAGVRLIATKEITLKNDPYNVRAKRIYAEAWAQYEKEKAGR